MSNKALPEVDQDGRIFGNKDEKKQFNFPIGWNESVVVTQYMVTNHASGHQSVDEGTRRLMPYNTDVFNKLEKDGGFGDTQYVILHDPR